MSPNLILSTCGSCGREHSVRFSNRPDGPHPQPFCSRECYYQSKRDKPPKALLDRLGDKFLVGDGCWPWVGAIQPGTGYGAVNVGIAADGSKIVIGAHRVLYELFNGPIPTGLHIDHLCSVRTCVRPAHLEAVTQAENNRRAHIRRRGGE